jgi:hypothetical protein
VIGRVILDDGALQDARNLCSQGTLPQDICQILGL